MTRIPPPPSHSPFQPLPMSLSPALLDETLILDTPRCFKYTVFHWAKNTVVCWKQSQTMRSNNGTYKEKFLSSLKSAGH